MAEELTAQQKLAITNRGGSLLVSAAAGSGKTKVLVDRILSYILDSTDPANLDDFLIITYTKAAAAELRGKVAAKLTERISEHPENLHLQKQMQRLYLAKISTVHSFCTDIIREYAYKLDLPTDFRMAEESECQQLQARVLEQLLNDVYETISENPDLQTFIDTQGFGRDDRKIPEIILKVYNSARCHLNPTQWLHWCIASTQVSELTDASQTPWGDYLIKDLHNRLDLHLEAMRNCVSTASKVTGMEKVVDTLNSDIRRLETYRACGDWDSVHNCGELAFTKFPGKYSDKELADRIKAVRLCCKKEISKKLLAFVDSSAQVLKDLGITGASARGLLDLVDRFTEGYSKIKRSYRVLDFSDLEHLTLDLFLGKNRQEQTAIAREVSQRFREILVDEYQDSNEVQDAIFGALTAHKNNLFMVGDVKQSIYSFRLANPQIFIDKYDAYLGAEKAKDSQPRKVVLSHNFRSAGQVIDAVNDIFSNCMSKKVGGLEYGEDEMLREGIVHSAAKEPEIELYTIQADEDTYFEEATFVAQRIKQLLDGTHEIRKGDVFKKIEAEDIVILLRSPGSVGAEFCNALRELGIRCSTGTSEDLLETEEVGGLYALLQTISNPLQDIPLAASLASKIFCFTADELAAIRKENTTSALYTVLQQSEDPKVCAFVEMLKDFRRQSRMCSITQLIEYIFVRTGLDSVYAAMPDGAEKTANIQTFCQFASSFESTGKKDLEQFLEQLEAVKEKGFEVSGEQKPHGCVRIMSIHKSKGLEFPVVFLCALGRKFNQKSIQEQVLCDKDLGLGLACVDTVKRIRYPSIAKRAISLKITSESISEELRVLYVALTRAKDRLIMTYATQYLATALNDIANRIDLSGQLLITSGVNCPGKWILQTAMRRTEAGELHALSSHPDCTCVSKNPWLIRTVEASGEIDILVTGENKDLNGTLPAGAVEKMRKHLNAKYPYPLATVAPSKQTATQLKGRGIDQEISENTVYARFAHRSFRKPSFIEQQTDGKTFGNAVHSIMQHIDFSKCQTIASIEEEITRLIKQGVVDASVAGKISNEDILKFFITPIGQKLIHAENVLKEFKFSILDDGDKYAPGMYGEKVLLQGVVDCALIEDDGITVIDFKTDRVDDDSILGTVQKYTPQITAYADALGRIYQTKVKGAYLYFFRVGKLICIQ